MSKGVLYVWGTRAMAMKSEQMEADAIATEMEYPTMTMRTARPLLKILGTQNITFIK